MTAINASCDTLNNSDVLVFLYKCDTMNLLNYAIPSIVGFATPVCHVHNLVVINQILDKSPLSVVTLSLKESIH